MYELWFMLTAFRITYHWESLPGTVTSSLTTDTSFKISYKDLHPGDTKTYILTGFNTADATLSSNLKYAFLFLILLSYCTIHCNYPANSSCALPTKWNQF